MCGIAGHINVGASASDLRRVAVAMADAVKHRGPDDSGVWVDETAGIALAHRRLAILDLSPAGHQPMVSVDGRWVIAFNGEIYNHLALRKRLAVSGQSIAWRGHSDTETLLACVAHWGVESAIEATVGMFALALWDRQEQVLLLARDRLGEKPLYYGWQGQTLLFGSELKALKVHSAFKSEIDREALSAFMRYGYVPAPQSIYRGIRKLPPGMLLRVRAGGEGKAAPVPFWSLLHAARRGSEAPFGGSETEAVAALERVLSEAVALQQIADVPVGAFLSGGIDSSTIVALMQVQSRRPVQTFTVGFEDRQYNEAESARKVARYLGTDHTELYVTADQARAVIPRLSSLYDEPFAAASQIPTLLVSELARRHVTVSLSGDAGDELFAGYNRYTWAQKVQKIPRSVRGWVARSLLRLSPAQWNRMYAVVYPMLPRSLRVRTAGDKAHKLAAILPLCSEAAIYQRLVSAWSNPGELVIDGHEAANVSAAFDRLTDFDSPEQRMMVLDALTYLPDEILCKVDRAAMASSLETRVPFLDHRVVEFAWHLPLHMKIRKGQGKWILRQLLFKYVPRHLVERPKMGFAVPVGAWLRGPLRSWADELLREARLRREGYLEPSPIRKKWQEHLSGQRNWDVQLWYVLMFQAWLAEQ